MLINDHIYETINFLSLLVLFFSAVLGFSILEDVLRWKKHIFINTCFVLPHFNQTVKYIFLVFKCSRWFSQAPYTQRSIKSQRFAYVRQTFHSHSFSSSIQPKLFPHSYANNFFLLRKICVLLETYKAHFFASSSIVANYECVVYKQHQDVDICWTQIWSLFYYFFFALVSSLPYSRVHPNSELTKKSARKKSSLHKFLSFSVEHFSHFLSPFTRLALP